MRQCYVFLAFVATLLLTANAGRSLEQAAPSAKKAPIWKLYFAHINDVHNRIEQASNSLVVPCSPADVNNNLCYGGYGRISTLLKTLRRQAATEKATFYFFNAGDEFLGTLWDVLYKGAATALLQSKLHSVKPSVQTVGNHEYDYGPGRLAEYIKNVSHPFTSCNTEVSAEPSLKGLLKPYVLLKHPNLTIAVIGWTTPDTAFISNVGGVKFTPIVQSAKAAITKLKKDVKGPIHIIVGLSHAGYEVDQQVAAAVPDLDIIIGGHSHTFLAGQGKAPVLNLATNATDTPLGPYPSYVQAPLNYGKTKSIPVVQAYWGSKYLGLLKLTYQQGRGLQILDDGSGPVLLGGANSSNPVAQDPAVAKLVAPLAQAVNDLNGQVIGKALVTLEGAREIVRSRETNLANYITDNMVQYVRGLSGFEEREGETFIAITNGGGIRATINQGDITLGQVISVLPFGNVVAVVKITGEQLINAIKDSLIGYPGNGRFAQVAGLRYFHSNGAFLSVSLLKNGEQQPVDPTARYNVVTNDFMANGGDGFVNLAAGTKLLPTGAPLDQVVIGAISADPDGISPEVEGRIINCADIQCATETSGIVRTGCSCA